ncbi:MAG: hypothetical protein AB7E32_07510 [Desulfovibrio sp.]
MRKQITTLLGFGLLMLLFAGTASASIISSSVDFGTLYYGIGADASTLETNLLTTYYVNQTETYEGIGAGTSVSSYNSPIGGFTGYGTVLDTNTAGMFAAAGTNYLAVAYNGSVSRNWSFSLDNPSDSLAGMDYRAVGFYVTGFDSSKDFILTVSYADGSTATINLGAMVSETVDSGVAIYFGIVGDKRISGFTVANVQDQYAIDNVSAMSTPIPGAVWLFGTGLLGLLGYRRMRG